MYVKTGSSLEHTLGNSYKTHSESESERRSVMSDSLRPRGLYSPWNSLGQNTGMGSLSLLQGIFLTQGLNPGLPHCSQILYQLSHKGSPRILEWVAYPFSRHLPDSGIELGSPALRTELSGKPKTHSEVKLYSEEKYILKPSFTIYYIYIVTIYIEMKIFHNCTNCIKYIMYYIPGLGRSPGEGDGIPLQFSCLENPMDRGA